MSKKQRQETASGDFRNTPFKALKGVSVKAGAAAPAMSPSSRPAAAEEDPEELFRRAMSGATPLHPAGENAPVRPVASPAAAAAPDDAPDRQLFLDAMRAVGAASFGERAAEPQEDEHAADRRSPSSRMKQLRKGTVRIGHELDLHGSLKDEAVRRLEHFIAAAAAQGHQAVLVITGKGLNSPEGPVLQGAVAGWLGGPGRSRVAEFHPAPRDKGGSGAFVVFLRPPGKR